MSWIWDFIQGFGRAAKQAANWKTWTTDVPEDEDIEWFMQLDNWEIVWIVKWDDSFFEDAWTAIWKAAWYVWGFLWNAVQNSTIVWSMFDTKQTIDDQLVWLQYNWKPTNLSEKNTYMWLLSQYEYLASLENPTIKDAALQQVIDNELQKYTVPDYEDDGEWDWENTWIWKIFPEHFLGIWTHDLWVNHKKRKQVDRQKIIDVVTNNEKLWNYFNTPSPKQISWEDVDDDENTVRFFTEEEFEKENKSIKANDVVQNKINELTERALRDPNFKITWRENEIINADTIQWLLENAMSIDGINTIYESYKEAYKKLEEEETPVLKDILRSNIEWMLELQFYQLSQNDKSSKDAYFEYVKDHPNPLKLDFESRYSEMNNFEKWLVEWINSLFWVVPLWKWWDTWVFSMEDWADKADFLSRLINVWRSKNILQAWANILMLTGTQLSWLLQLWVDSILMSSDIAYDYIKTWELKYTDYENYLFWMMTPDIFTIKEKTQEYAMPKTTEEKTRITIYETAWLVDDIMAILAPLKWWAPVKNAKLWDIAEVVAKVENKAAKWEKAIEKWKKIIDKWTKTVSKWADKVDDVTSKASKTATKAAPTTESAEQEIVTKVQKATWKYWEKEFEDSAKWAVKRMVQRWKDNRAAKKAADKELKEWIAKASDMVKLWNWEELFYDNVIRWVAENSLQSLYFQSLTPYDYEDTDFVLDLAWAMFDWFLRVKQFSNRLWQLKYSAINRNKIWWLWYLKEAAWLSDDWVENALKALTESDLEILWTAVNNVLWEVVKTWEKLTPKKFKSKIQKLSQTSREWLRNNLQSLIDIANNDLIKKLKSSTNKKYNSMVKEVKEVWEDWKVRRVWKFNKPESMSEKKWNKKLNEAREKAYSPGGLDWQKWLVWKINNIKNYVKKNLAVLAKNSRFVEKKNWKYRFKSWVTEAQKENLYRRIVVQRLKDMWIDIRSESKLFRKEYKIRAQRNETFKALYEAWIWDEIENPLWPIWQRLAIFVNDFLASKIYWKDLLIAWLNQFWASVWLAFKRWLKEYMHIWDYRDLTMKELYKMIILFWKTFDEKIAKEFMVKAKVFNEKWFMRNNSEMIINMPYEKAIEINPDLAYMWVVMFDKIIAQTDNVISDLEKEIKLRTYKWDPKTSWRVENEFYWIARKSSVGRWLDWTKVFNDHYEEKKLMWKRWTLYLKLNKESRDQILEWVNDWNIFDKKTNPNWAWVMEVEYELLWKNILKEWAKEYTTLTVYAIYEKLPNWDRWEQIWWLRTFSDPVMKEWKDASKAWWDVRLMNIELTNEKFNDVEYSSANFSLYRDWREEVIVHENDLSRDYDTSNIAVADSTFDPSNISRNKKSTNISTWNNIVLHIIRDWDVSVKSWETFTQLLPWRTDKVPYEFYVYVMSLPKYKEFWKHKINLILSMMYNDNVVQTKHWIRVNMSGKYQFKTDTKTITYKQTNQDKEWKKTSDLKEYTILSDWRIVIWNRKIWVVVIQKDSKWSPQIFTYKLREWSTTDVYDLFKPEDVNFERPVWEFWLWNRTLISYLYNWKNRERVLWSIEFISKIWSKWKEVDIDAMIRAAREDVDDIWSFWNIDKKVKVDSYSPDTYDEIYREVFWEDMPMRERVALRSMKWMTPERYLNQIISNFENSRFWRFFDFNKDLPRKEVVKNLRQANSIIKELEDYVRKYDVDLTDKQLVDIFMEYKTRMASWSFNLTPEEIEIRKMMYPHQSNNLNIDKFVRLAWYRDYWKIPKKMNTVQYRLLRQRRDRILAHRLWVEELDWLDDQTKDLLVERHFWQWGFYKTDAELEKDIIDHPDDYREILQAYGKKIKEYDQRVATVWKTDSEIDNITKQIRELENKLPWMNKKRKAWAVAKAKRQYTWSVLHWILTDELEAARSQLADLVDRFTVERTKELADQINELQNKIKELEEWDFLYKQITDFRNEVWDSDAITKEQRDDIVNRNIVWDEPWFVPHKMWKAEINKRLQQIRDRLPWVRILNYDPVNNRIDITWLTNSEVEFVSEQLQRAQQALYNWTATAAHIREIHAIVINPKMLQEMDIWHEWFHEALLLVWDQWFNGRVSRVFAQARDKFSDEIKRNAENLWYDKIYKNWLITESEYNRLITEEWLAERFWEFINWKYYEEFEKASNSFIKQFFMELWNRIKMMFSDTEIVDLFDDIYNMSKNPDEYKMNFNSLNVDWWDVKFRSINDELYNHIREKERNWEDLDITFWDILWIDDWRNPLVSEQLEKIDNLVANKWWPKNWLVLLSNDFTLRWWLLWLLSTDVVTNHWITIRTSALDIYEWIIDSSKSLEMDNMLSKIYWWADSELETRLDWAINRIEAWSDSEVINRNLYWNCPIIATIERDGDNLNFILSVKWVDKYRIAWSVWNEEKLHEDIIRSLIWDDWKKREFTRSIEAYLWDVSWLTIPDWNYKELRDTKWRIHISTLDWVYTIDTIDEAVDLLWQALWNSIEKNYKFIISEDFADYSTTSIDLCRLIYKTYLYNRIIPHLWKTSLWTSIVNDLYKLKRDKTAEILTIYSQWKAIDRMNALYWNASPEWKPFINPNIDFKIWYDPDNNVVIQFIIWSLFSKRRIWWHFTSESMVLNMIEKWTPNPDPIKQKIYDEVTWRFKEKKIKSNSWNISPLALSDEEFERTVTFNTNKTDLYVWKSFKQNYREWYNNKWKWDIWVRFRYNNTKRVPVINEEWVVWYYEQPFIETDPLLWAEFRRKANWTSDEDIANKKHKFVPVTFTTMDWQVENVKRLNEINRKYWISINKASPEQIKKLEEFRYESKKRNNKAIKKNAMHRQTLAQIRELKKKRWDLIAMRNDLVRTNKEFENSWVYRELNHIWEILKRNEEAQRLIKEANMDPNVVSEKKATTNNSIKQEEQELKVEKEVKENVEETIVEWKEDLYNNPPKDGENWWNGQENGWWSHAEESEIETWRSDEDSDIFPRDDDYSTKNTRDAWEERRLREEAILKEIDNDIRNPKIFDDMYNTWIKFIWRMKIEKAEPFEKFVERVKDEVDEFQRNIFTIWDDEWKFQRRMKAKIIKLQEEEGRVWTIAWKKVYDSKYKEYQQNIVMWKRDRYTEQIMEHYNVDQFQADDMYRNFEDSADAEYALTQTEITRMEKKEKTYFKRMSKKLEKMERWDYSWFIDRKDLVKRNKLWEEDAQSVATSLAPQTQVCPVTFIKK